MYFFIFLIPSLLRTTRLCFTPALDEKLIVSFEIIHEKLGVEDAN